jgi:hypothetical protein
MAKKSQVPPAPEMTSLPMSGGDSPLVIDLPDGQKLVVGNLAAGSVIEVATWRGTGRPDSRTSRLMLGMSSATATSAESAPGESKKESSSFIQKTTATLKSITGKALSVAASRKKSSDEKKSATPFIETVAPVVNRNETEEVDDWLNSILEKSAKKTAVKPVTTPAAKKAAVKKAAPKKTTTGRKR